MHSDTTSPAKTTAKQTGTLEIPRDSEAAAKMLSLYSPKNLQANPHQSLHPLSATDNTLIRTPFPNSAILPYLRSLKISFSRFSHGLLDVG